MAEHDCEVDGGAGFEREHGESSITFLRSVYYMFKVTLALLVAMVRSRARQRM